MSQPSGVKSLAPDSKEYLAQDPSSIPADERFIWEFMKEKSKHKLDDEHDSDAQSVNSEDFDAALDQERAVADLDQDIDFAGAMDQEVLEQGDREEEEEDSGEEEEETFEAVDNFSDLSDDEMAGDDAGDSDDDSDDDMMLKLEGDRYGHRAIF